MTEFVPGPQPDVSSNRADTRQGQDDLSRAVRWYEQGHPREAEEHCRRILDAAPDRADAWSLLGVTRRAQGRPAGAVDALRRALALRPHYPEAYNNLGIAFFQLDHLAVAEDALLSALQLRPGYTRALQNLAILRQARGRFADALECARQAAAAAPAEIQPRLDLATFLLAAGHWVEGWSAYEVRLDLNAASWTWLTVPRWQGETLDGRTLLLVAEQGLGDIIHFVRYARTLKERHACRLILAVQPDLHPLLEQVSAVDGFVLPGDPASCAGVDVYCPLMSLPGLLGETGHGDWSDAVPYLQARPERVAEWRRRLAGEEGFRVGIVWQGNPRHPADWLRSFPLAALDPLRRLHGIRLISLQQGAGTEQLDAWAGIPTIMPLGEELDAATGRFEETAAVLASLDLLICADTAVAHLAGAMGRPVWLALGRAPDWRWGPTGERTPWYPAMRLFRRQESDRWPDLFAAMARELVAADNPVRDRSPREYHLLDGGLNRLAQTRQGVMMYPRHDRYVGRSLELYGEFSPGETELLQQVAGPGMTVVDAGAHIGAHTLLLSRRVGPEGIVHAFEPQPFLYRMLCANLSLNGVTNVMAHPEALGREPGTAWLPPVDYSREGNFGGVALGDDPSGERVAVVALDRLALPACHLLKIDVEGMERAVLAGAGETIHRHRPVLYVENDRADGSAELIRALMDLGYRLYWHLAPLFSADNYYANPTNEFGRLVSANMLGIPAEREFPVVGLRPVTSPASRWDDPDAE